MPADEVGDAFGFHLGATSAAGGVLAAVVHLDVGDPLTAPASTDRVVPIHQLGGLT